MKSTRGFTGKIYHISFCWRRNQLVCLQDECFIATAAFGKLQPGVVLLRQFRDERCYQQPGATTCGLYYQHSPPIAQYRRERGNQINVKVY